MLFDLPSDDLLYAALVARDPVYDGFAFVGVKSTGIFCRLTCAARKPKKENTVFFPTVVGAMEAGYRPCKRCRPLALHSERDPVVSVLLERLESEPEKRWSEEDIKALKLDPSTARRAFKRQFGVTFLEMARLRRLSRGIDVIASGDNIIAAQLEASYESGSGFRSAIARLIGTAPSRARQLQFLHAHWIETPVGSMLAVADSQSLYLLEFFDRKGLPNELVKLKALTGSEIIMQKNPVIDRIEQELNGYFSGRQIHFDTPLVQSGTLFTRTVWDALRTILLGTTESYSSLAAMIGHPSATRAVARANGANQIAIVVPCHRVIGANGSLTGYAGGLWRKQWLLEHERRMLLGQPGE